MLKRRGKGDQQKGFSGGGVESDMGFKALR
jgi:hypothetical protein